MPESVTVQLTDGTNVYDGKRADEFNFVVQGVFAAAQGSYTLLVYANGAELFKMPIKYLKF